MAADLSIVSLLIANQGLLELFKKVVERRKASLQELSGSADKLDSAEAGLAQLSDAKLIAVERAPVREWNTYYVTAGGLEVDRAMKRIRS
jgi:hypothetical protein